MKKIMFVCTGNTCRSPMAEVILRAMLKDKSVTGIKVSSGGVSPVVGQPIMENANKALEKLGFKPVKYRAKQFLKTDIEEQDLIICMTESHKKYIGNFENITTVAAITGLHDVDDPYGDSVETYIKTAEYLKYACGDIISLIQKALLAEKQEKANLAALKKRKVAEAKALKAVSKPPKEKVRSKKEKVKSNDSDSVRPRRRQS